MGSILKPDTDDDPTIGVQAGRAGVGAVKGALQGFSQMQRPQQRGMPSQITVPQAPDIQVPPGQTGNFPQSRRGPSNPFYGQM